MFIINMYIKYIKKITKKYTYFLFDLFIYFIVIVISHLESGGVIICHVDMVVCTWKINFRNLSSAVWLFTLVGWLCGWFLCRFFMNRNGGYISLCVFLFVYVCGWKINLQKAFGRYRNKDTQRERAGGREHTVGFGWISVLTCG